MSLTCKVPVTELDSVQYEKSTPQTIVHTTIETLTQTNNLLEDPSKEDSFFVCDLSAVERQLAKWKTHLPMVAPHYAVKCNNDPAVLRHLAQLGCNFDCASYREIEKILSLDVHPSRIVYANTIKNPSYVRWAADHGVQRMTFDNVDELYKIAKYAPHAELLLRIITDDSDAVCQLSCKFGAPLSSTQGLLALAKDLGLKVVGVAFHIGSGGAVDAYPKALKDAASVFDEAKAIGTHMSLLDIGGGFEDETFELAATAIRSSLEVFPAGVEVIAEPGRFMVAGAFTLVCAVIGRRETREGNMLYITDGCYANLNCIIYDHQMPVPQLVHCSAHGHAHAHGHSDYKASVWGPTCDGIDKISDGTVFGRQVKIGDWIYFEGVGAYTLSASTTFNGFNMATRVHYVYSSGSEHASTSESETGGSESPSAYSSPCSSPSSP